jgi:hypothetical protein
LCTVWQPRFQQVALPAAVRPALVDAILLDRDDTFAETEITHSCSPVDA